MSSQNDSQRTGCAAEVRPGAERGAPGPYGQRPPAVFMTADAMAGNTSTLMGRQSAGLGFMRGLARAYREQPAHPLQILSPKLQDTQHAERQLAAEGFKHPVVHLPSTQPAQWAGFDLLHYPAPPSDQIAWQRARRGVDAFAVSGVTHTISSDRVMRQLAAYFTGPFAAWDALICTSQSVLRAVHHVWEAQAEYLTWRMGHAPRPELPMLPVIPLGVHGSDFEPHAAERAAGRAQWDLAADEVVVLFVGRLSLHAKANPLPMYLACARAAAQSGKKVRVLECGWFANEAVKACYDEAARAAGVNLTRVDGREPGIARRAYAAADIFCSLSDNIQETFGLTPVEAMAAGLPVVVSNWDGYRETVRDGVDGFLVEARQPVDTAAAEDLIRDYEDERLDYDKYVAHAHMIVSVDVPACANAIAWLASDPVLRQRMGAAGREHVKQRFDWQVVMGQYQALWNEQAQRLQHAREQALSDASAASWSQARTHPAMPNPLAMFAHYPSAGFEASTRLWRDAALEPRAQGWLSPRQARSLGMWVFSASHWIPPADTLETACAALPGPGEPGLTLAIWAERIGMPLVQAERMAAFAHKAGLLFADALPPSKPLS